MNGKSECTIPSKKSLEVRLSRLKGFFAPKVRAEQYITPSEIAAEILWMAKMSGDIEGKRIADLGCGTGILGIGCLLLGASKVYFVEKDSDVIPHIKENLIAEEGFPDGMAIINNQDVRDFSLEVDTVVMNPPFGTKEAHLDRIFLDSALLRAKVSYSIHKTETVEYLISYALRKGFILRERLDFEYLLSNSMHHHVKKKHYIRASCLILTRK